MDPQKLLTIARSRKILKQCCSEFCSTAMLCRVSSKALGWGRFLRLRIFQVGFWGFWCGGGCKGSGIQQEGFEGRFQGRLCCRKVLAKTNVAGTVVGFLKVLGKEHNAAYRRNAQ